MSERPEQEQIRFQKLANLVEGGFSYPNDAKPTASSVELLEGNHPEGEEGPRFIICGRIVQMRQMGKASFCHLLDGKGRIQTYIRKDDVGEEAYEAFKHFDVGDIIEVKGYLFTTKTGEKTLHGESVRLLTKCLIPLPEKWHGLTDVEARYRHRYVDLIANPDVREVFRKRARILSHTRAFLERHDYLEVETPVLTYSSAGAEARPFETHYNALSADMSLRIALELPLKKLVVGGLEKVYEISKVFRNEGLSKKHNPEFTMLEFYCAYQTFEDQMEFVESMLSELAESVTGSSTVTFGEQTISFERPFKRVSMTDSVYEFAGVPREKDVTDIAVLHAIGAEHKIDFPEPDDWGRCLDEIWGELVEPKLVNPTFITHHPFSISPLARKTAGNERIVDRFELIIAGMEISNAFSELNDPIDQRERFEDQAARKAQGKDASSDIDHDFLKALEYGMPPTAGVGIGIDRLVMLLTNSPTIRDVMLFPQLRPLEEE
ncbi:MAG: lysine--tRNA ligase [Bdellovibrionales bacterium]|nr:lysine--tRNA ligase [Bdellovibrionales bacterium]